MRAKELDKYVSFIARVSMRKLLIGNVQLSKIRNREVEIRIQLKAWYK